MVAIAFVIFFPRSTSNPVSLCGLRYFNARQAEVLTARILRDDPSKAQVRQSVSKEEFMTAVCYAISHQGSRCPGSSQVIDYQLDIHPASDNNSVWHGVDYLAVRVRSVDCCVLRVWSAEIERYGFHRSLDLASNNGVLGLDGVSSFVRYKQQSSVILIFL